MDNVLVDFQFAFSKLEPKAHEKRGDKFEGSGIRFI